jgi:hypothetical protein
MDWVGKELTTAAARAVEVTVVGETEMQEQALEIRASIGTDVAGENILASVLASSRWRWCRLTQYTLTGDM